MTKSSTKGGAFERKCGRLISSWLTDGEDDSQLIRSVSSGGWKRRRVRQVGDLAPNGPAGLEFRQVFGVECKNRQEFEWKHVWSSGDPKLLRWWRKHVGECEDADLAPMILHKRNYQPLLVGFPPGLIETGFWSREAVVSVGSDSLHLVTWEEFAEVMRPDDLLSMGRRWLS